MSDPHLNAFSKPVWAYIQLFVRLKSLVIETEKEMFDQILKQLSAHQYVKVDVSVRELLVEMARAYGTRASSQMQTEGHFDYGTFKACNDATQQLGRLLRDWQAAAVAHGYVSVMGMLDNSDFARVLDAIRDADMVHQPED